MSIGLRFIQKSDHPRKKSCLRAAILADLQTASSLAWGEAMTDSRPCAFGWESDTGEWRAHGQLLKPVTSHVASGLGVASHPEVWVWFECKIGKELWMCTRSQEESVEIDRTRLWELRVWPEAHAPALPSGVTLGMPLKLSGHVRLWNRSESVCLSLCRQ